MVFLQPWWWLCLKSFSFGIWRPICNFWWSHIHRMHLFEQSRPLCIGICLLGREEKIGVGTKRNFVNLVLIVLQFKFPHSNTKRQRATWEVSQKTSFVVAQVFCSKYTRKEMSQKKMLLLIILFDVFPKCYSKNSLNLNLLNSLLKTCFGK